MKDALGRPGSALVLGASSEIAGAVISGLVERGTTRLILAGRDPAALEPLAARLRDRGATDIETLAFDATDPASHRGAVEAAFARGDVDLVLLAFGILGDQMADERDAPAAARVVETNFTGAVSVGILIAERLRRQGHGTIVVLSSVAGERVRRSNYIYGASKAGLDAFYQGLAASLVGDAVHVLIVRPGFVRTRMTAGMSPAPLATTPEAVARVVLRGLDRKAHVVWAPPPLRYVMAVLRHVPTAMFRRLPL